MANDTNNLSPPLQSERTPLRDDDDGTHSSTSARISPAILIIPVAIASRLAGKVPVTTILQIIQKLVCKFRYEWTDPDSFPLDGRISESLCARPEIEHNYEVSVTVFEVIEGMWAVGFFASRCGRKPILLAAFGAAIFGYILGMASKLTLQRMLKRLRCVFPWVSKHCQALQLQATANMYIVDVSTTRTITLSTINSWWTLAEALSYGVGGLIMTQSNQSIPVYLNLFPKKSAKELRRKRLAHAEAEPVSKSDQRFSALWYALTAVTLLFEPLKQLTPKRKWNVKYNFRLLYCAAHVFVTQIGSRYAPLAIIIYYTTKYSYNPAQHAFLSSVMTLTTIIPMIVRFLQSFYKKRAGAYEEGEVSNNEVAETSGKLELHIIFVSWILAAPAMVFAGSAPTFPWQFFAVICLGLSTGHVPVLGSVVAAPAEPLKQGETLAAVEMASSVGQTLSSIIMGIVLTL
ncbi:hypothetical protein BJ138DRAFT_1116732 [Hygrophoropsis aurantiaca]|uniref:Uncharacterized protein n=1 Tax=Hygrophoropsis aurantiaca TaxID=72124 RepID=A0ACB8A250_9AGAM|nr:hypothetical protein BJ138DRAFT_1116732 [Hygrophoropsis aurantiaca]